MAKIYQTASVLYDVLRTVVPSGNVDDETKRYAEDVEKKKEQHEPYNILPLYTVGIKPAIMELPEVVYEIRMESFWIKAALRAIRRVDNLPDTDKSVNDILEWLSSVFGFQKGNVANQREHLILLLANIDARNKNLEVNEQKNLAGYEQLDSGTVTKLMDKIFKNYRSWCAYLHCPSNLEFPERADMQQLELLYIGLYLLIWGEASNIRFMPECICYIFHNEYSYE
ncbi:unnamed protein product [Ilex paraguariensis]|uniref:1,3-beta-glucan synthase component FKS1-like domain-containing protein n=1 Tax=Ilex paraguariensis TaxID=185542 RepID=A0ABC8U3W4_9AQUA